MIAYVQGTVLIKEMSDEQITERGVEATLAEGVGLAYRIEPGEGDDDPVITVTHVRSGGRIGGTWYVSTEQEVQSWIAALNEVIDWTGERPQIRPGKHYKVLELATIGALHES